MQQHVVVTTDYLQRIKLKFAKKKKKVFLIFSVYDKGPTHLKNLIGGELLMEISKQLKTNMSYQAESISEYVL